MQKTIVKTRSPKKVTIPGYGGEHQSDGASFSGRPAASIEVVSFDESDPPHCFRNLVCICGIGPQGGNLGGITIPKEDIPALVKALNEAMAGS